MAKKKHVKIIHYVSALVLAVILVCQFTPFWTYATNDGDESVSISSYVWFPSDNKGVDSYISSNVENYAIDHIVIPVILVLVLSVVGLVLCLVKNGTVVSSVLTLCCGLSGLWGFLFMAPFKLGTAWGTHMILYVVALVLGAVALYFCFKTDKQA